jgi:hypothetical protein
MNKKLLFFNLPLTQRLEVRKILLEYSGGVYIFQNKNNKKRYVGSSIRLVKRISNYYDLNHKKVSPILSNAIKKYGLDSFTLQIYCFKDISSEAVLALEQYLFQVLNPEYNILKIAGNNTGHKLDKESRDKLSAIILARGWKKELHPSWNSGKEVYLYEILDNKLILKETFSNISRAYEALEVSRSTLWKYINNETIIFSCIKAPKNKLVLYIPTR